MTTAELAKYYSDLLILQYIGKPKAYATIGAVVTPVLIDQMPIAVQNAYEIGTAVGVQLDVIGKYVGVSRNGNGLEGQAISLDDSDYTQLIKMVIIKNNSGSSLATIQSLLSANFPGEIFVSDNQDMGLNYVLVETLGTSDLLELIVTGGYLPKPMGVETSVVIVPAHEFPFFGLRTYESEDLTVAPLNSYEFVNLNSPILTY